MGVHNIVKRSLFVRNIFHPFFPKNQICLSSSSGGGVGDNGSANEPSTAWQRGAIAVKNVDVTNPYLEAIRQTHDPALHIKTLEEELAGSIGQALGKQGRKVLMWMKVMEQEKQNYENLIAKRAGLKEIQKIVLAHNDAREKAITARWELTVHRQAAGFRINNHKFVHDMFRIDDKLSMEDKIENINGGRNRMHEKESKEKKKKFGDQLDWWEKIGRWR